MSSVACTPISLTRKVSTLLGRFMLGALLLLVSNLSLTAEPIGRFPRGATAARLPVSAQIDPAIKLAGGYLERACGPDGKFVYEVDINTGKQSPDYNIVRHAGAIYALAMLNRSKPDPKALDPMVRAATFMQGYIGPGVLPGQLAVWSEPAKKHSVAQLGATGLGLVALTEVWKVAPKIVSLQELQALGRFASFLQREDGSFVEMYKLDKGPIERFHSPYYPGEAALGFIALYEADHSRDWLNSAGKALSYLSKTIPANFNGPLDQWALIAIAKLIPYCRGESCPEASRKELIQYAITVCNWIVHNQLRNPASPLDGAFDRQGQTAPVAANAEGLLNALEFLPRDALAANVEATAARGVAFLLRVQLQGGRFKGGVPGAFSNSASNSSKIRADYVQHALCAWLESKIIIPTKGGS